MRRREFPFMNILITGGAGYIGSHVAKLLLETTDHDVTILDNLSTGRLDTVNTLETVAHLSNRGALRFYQTDLSDFTAIERIFLTDRYDAILHFAASIIVPESLSNPLKYYMNNTINTANLIRCSVQYKVASFIFSSTAAVYGEPATALINETTPTRPINPYGMSKLMSETILQDAAAAHSDLRFVILRYFNVAGASLDNAIGQSFPNATNLIKIAAECAASKRTEMAIYGEDYPTPDGTCIRDYIHVEDLASAHLAALEYLARQGKSDIFNCGYGHGYSVREVIQTMKKVSGTDFAVREAPRRNGDPAQVIADTRKILSALSWNPKYDDLSLICETALAWEKHLAEKRV